MTEQERLDKAINGLEQFIADFKPFCGNKADWQRVYDALALLKAQEPRVIDADEIVLSADPSYWIWIEIKGRYCAEAYKKGKTINGLIVFDTTIPFAEIDALKPDEYGIKWRCWTSRPTEAQREATPW